MGRFDKRKSMKMRRRRAQKKKHQREKLRRTGAVTPAKKKTSE
jgi:hypothetical protein